jgi:hypothetical protein
MVPKYYCKIDTIQEASLNKHALQLSFLPLAPSSLSSFSLLLLIEREGDLENAS